MNSKYIPQFRSNLDNGSDGKTYKTANGLRIMEQLDDGIISKTNLGFINEECFHEVENGRYY